MVKNDKFGDNGLRYVTFDDGICNDCIHVRDNGYECDAFPDGIPNEILTGEIDHHKPHPDDNGIQFEKNPNTVRGE